METSPFRARRIPPAEARRIIKRAAELGALDPGSEAAGESFTEAELAQRLEALGLPDDAIRRAMAAPSTSEQPSLVKALRVVHEEDVEGALPADQHERIAEAISASMKMRGRVEVVGNKLTWTPGTPVGEPVITVHSKGGRTLVRVEETLAHRGQLIVASITAAVFASMFATPAAIAVAKVSGSSALLSAAIITSFLIACAGAAAVVVRKLFRRRVKTRTRALDEVMADVVTVVRGSVVRPAQRTRVAAPDGAEASLEGEAEAEAEAEAEGIARHDHVRGHSSE
jgi:hypothetical protein